MADQNKLYTLQLNEEQIKIVAWETKKYHEQLLQGGESIDMPLPIAVLAMGYESVYKLCNDVLADKMIIEDQDEPKEQPDGDIEDETTVKDDESTVKDEETSENTGETTENPVKDEENTEKTEETDTNKENTEESGTETPKEDTEDGWVRPDEYKDSPLTDEEIKDLLSWLDQ